MSLTGKDLTGNSGRRDSVTFLLLPEIVEMLDAFCREKKVPRDRVVERALVEYFREGEMSH
ncbi:MAG: hypothetical protein ACM3NF_02385 [Gemmatimonadota bacterium]